MKNLLLIIVMTISAFGWEVNTHRAIDRKAIQVASNLGNFLQLPYNKQRGER